ncbi:MAG TPA: helix-turn-helix domain-containing protein [Acidimicrobiales bacterium]|jgi:predicted ArsR family transcriptional regulator|nr:helix-turn-helix domain-containing protein [Acidimicrobiales bacterium]
MEQLPLSAAAFSAGVTAATSAFGDSTRRDIYLFAHDATDGVTTSDVAQRFGLHPNVARHHLDKLAAGGYLQVQLGRPGKPGAGRPSKRYQVTDKALALEFPVRRDDLLIALLGRTLALVPTEAAEAMAEVVGEEYGRSLAASMAPGEGHRSLQAALHAVADALTAHGFASHTESRADGLAIISEQCPFGGAAVQHPVICAVDRGIVKGMLETLYGDTVPETSASRPLGDAVCVTLV